MPVHQLDVIVRVAGATLMIVAALMRARRTSQANALFFGVLALCLCSFLAGNTPDPALRLTSMAGRAAVFLSGWTAVFLWWFCLSVFDWAFKPRGVVLYTGLAWMVVACADRGIFGEALADRGLSWLLIAMGLGIVIHLAWRLQLDRPGDMIDQRRRARAWVVALLAGQLLADMTVDLVLGFDWQPQGFAIAQNLALLVFAGWLLTLEGSRDAHSSLTAIRSSTSLIGLSENEQVPGLGLRLHRLIEVDRVHLDAALDFATFVGLMGASERAVRGLIHNQLGYDHFRTFLNAHRMVEARRLLLDPARQRDKLIVIAMDSGFASLPSFNRVFQSFEGASPSAFRQAGRLQDGSVAKEKSASAGI